MIDKAYVEFVLGREASDDLVEQINQELWDNDTIVDLIHDTIQQHVD